jgi:hypothetical protein
MPPEVAGIMGWGRVAGTVHAARLRARGLAGRLAIHPARWDLIAALLYVAVSLLVYAVNPDSGRPGADGHYSWMYARSLAYDRDLDFTNDYALCGDPFAVGWTTHAHRPANIFYIGPAVFWTPPIWVLKHFVGGAPTVAGGCVGPIPALVLTLSSVAGGVLVLATGAILRRWVGPRTAALASLLSTLGGHVIYFTAINPSYSHAYDAMCVALYLYAVVRIRERGDTPARLALAGVLLGLAILQRSSNTVFFLVAVGALLEPKPAAALVRSARSLFLLGACAVLSGVVPLLAANKAIFGRAILFAHGPHFLWPAHAHPWLLLFDQRDGLFDAAPVLWLAVPGLALLLRKRDALWLVFPLLFCAGFELYLSSSALDWQGARRLTNLTPLAAWCIALTLQRAGRWLWARPGRVVVFAGASAVAAVAWANASVAFGFARGKLGWDLPLTSSERYGEAEKQALAAMEEDVGSLSILPAEWLFALRYRLKPLAFGWAAHPQWFERDHHSLDYARGDFPFTAPETRGLLRGVRFDDSEPGACFVGSNAVAVFSIQWPVVTRVRLLYDATAAGTLSVRTRSFLGLQTAWDAGVPLPAGKQKKVFLRVPPGGLDSGINELELDRGSAAGSLCLHALEFVDDNRYAAAPEANASPPIHMWHAGPYLPDAAAAPALAVGHSGGAPWMVEVHETAAHQLAYFAGFLGNFEGPRVFDHGYRPRVAADSNGAVIEVHQAEAGGGALWSSAGRVAVTADPAALAWTSSSMYASGFHPAVASLGGQVVEVHMADAEGSALRWQTARWVGASVVWNAMQALGTPGHNPSVAVAAEVDGDPLVVEVHQKDPAFGAMWMRAGRLHHDGSMTWKDSYQYDEGAFPAIAVFGTTLVEIHQGQDANGTLWMKIGTLGDDGRASWTSTAKYDEGAHPALALDPVAGKGLEAHEGGAGYGALWAHDLDVYGVDPASGASGP